MSGLFVQEKIQIKYFGHYIISMNELDFLHTKVDSKRVHQRKDLTFEEVCPIWSEKFKKGLDSLDMHILASDSKYCLVGEAWGFTGKQTGYFIAPLIPIVGCWTCIKYGRKFGFIAKKKESCSNSFEPLVEEFLVHWNKLHQNITLKNRARQTNSL